MRILLSCACGAVWKGDVTPEAVAQIKREWNAEHFGAGHGPATIKHAGAARRREENRAVKWADFF